MTSLALQGALGLLAPDPSWACAVCFGQGDNPDVARAYAWAIGILLACTFAILAAIVYAVYRIEARRSEILTARLFGRNGTGKLPKELARWK